MFFPDDFAVKWIKYTFVLRIKAIEMKLSFAQFDRFVAAANEMSCQQHKYHWSYVSCL
jgi:hypothetical protein